MTPHQLLLIITVSCGAAMVLGGIFLLARGAITLAATPQSTALSIEWAKRFKLYTQAPGLALFLIGLLFSLLALWFDDRERITPIEVVGEVQGVDSLAQSPVTLLVRSDWMQLRTTSKEIVGSIYPDVTVLAIQGRAPGYAADVHNVRVIDQHDHKVARLELKFTRELPDAGPPAAGAIEPAGFSAPAAEAAGSFGVPEQ